ncbi:MAG: hypothetical protein QM793_00460 [Muricomes sp.]
MRKYIKNSGCLLLLCMYLITVLSGCTNELTPGKLMSKVTENLSKVKSVSNSLDMYIDMESVLESTKVSMDMEMENTTKPMAGHAKGTAQVDMSGTKLGSDIEIYQVTEDKEFVTYSSMYGEWSRETARNPKKSAFSGNLFQEAGNSVKSFRIAEEAVTVEEKECYEMYGDITGKELFQFMGPDVVGAFGLIEIPEGDTIEKLKIPVTIDVYKEKMLPARVMIDMTDVMNELYEQYGKSTNVNNFMIKLTYTEFNQTQEITVPEDVKKAAKAAL